MNNNHLPLSIPVACAIAEILRCAQTCARVGWCEGEDGRVFYGQARSVGDVNGNFLMEGEDVRDGFLRVTLDSGWESFVPMATVIAKALRNEFVAI
jgi:hypothetical protein